MQSETPRTDAKLDELADDQRGQVSYNGPTFIEHARQLERENNTLKLKCAKMQSALERAETWFAIRANDDMVKQMREALK